MQNDVLIGTPVRRSYMRSVRVLSVDVTVLPF
jgi:hypothetical protein